MTQRSLYNNTTVALGPFGVFTGRWEPTSIFLEISAYVNSTAYLAIGIQQSQDASAVSINTTYNYAPTDEVTVFNTAVGLPFYRIVVSNEGNFQVGHMSATTILNALPSNVSATITGDVAITSPLDANGDVKVKATNLITETLATRRVDFLVVGDWYRVASSGLTSGAEWNALSGGTACVGGQSVPDIGRLFKCVAVGPAVAGGGTCYDVEYTEAVSATITNFPSFPATQPVSIAQDLSCNILNFPATQAVSGTVSLTSPTTVRVADYYGDPITTTAGNLMVGINNIYTANPLHTILDSGSVSLSGNSNGVKVNPTALPPSRKTGLGDTAKSVSGNILYGASYQNKSATVNCWLKLYDSVSAPTAINTPFLIQYLEAVQLYTLSHSNEDCFNAPITSTLWVRATLLPNDADNTDTGVEVEGTFFMGN